MNSGRTVFAQLIEFLPVREFRKCVDRYRGEYKVQRFTCLDQFLCMAFAQLTFRESLRDIETCLRAVRGKLYHMGTDQTIVLTGVNTAERYPDKLRRIRFVDAETRKNLVFLSNDFSLPPESIALLYKQRWQVELFFRWIKAFFGTSENAVKTQVWIAISVYVLVAIIRKRLNLEWSLY